jgi:hypothetical protein
MRKNLWFAAAILAACIAYTEVRLHVPGPATPDHALELALPMSNMQRYMDKLYFAGTEQNWKLAEFYLHEIHEQVEAIEEAHITEDGLNLSQLAPEHLETQIQSCSHVAREHDAGAFLEHYHTLVNQCNACHLTTRHGFIQIRIPDHSMIRNQQYDLAHTGT